MMDVEIRPELPADYERVRAVNEAAFGSAVEADLVEQLRIGGHVVVSLVADLDRKIVGHILFSQLQIVAEDKTIPALSLAPMAVIPEWQRRGIGTQLVEQGLTRCREQGHAIVFVLGHPEVYPRFGFSSELAKRFRSPFGGGEAWMAVELTPGALRDIEGEVVFAEPFSMFE